MEAKRSPKEAQASLKQRRAEASARLRASTELLRTAARMRRQEAVVEALQQAVLRGKTFRLDTLADLLLPQPWVLDDEGRIAGHVLTVDEDVLLHACDRDAFDVSVLPDVLTVEWSNLEERVLWGQAYADALRALADAADEATRAARDAHALRNVLRDSEA